MPPARRLPTSRPTVAGAPVDPAIISSQIAHPESNSQDRQKGVSNQTKAEPKNFPAQDDVVSELPKEFVKENKETVVNNSRLHAPSKASLSTVSATANVETEVLDSFRQFASTEKMRYSNHRRQRVSQDKAIKLNDLMKFSKNFKLHTPVPKDLVPILAKDKSKQEEIMEKAQRNAQSLTTPLRLATTLDQKSAATEARYDVTKASPSVSESKEYSPGRPIYTPQGPALSARERQQQPITMPIPSPKSGQDLLGHRLADNRRLHQAGLPVNVPQPLPIQMVSKTANRPTVNPPPISSSQASSSVRTPTSAVSAKFNVKAHEFRPNPAANTFKPTGIPSATSSPRSMAANTRPMSRASSPSIFFGNKKPLPAAERLSISDYFNPLKRLKERAQNEETSEEKLKDYAANGGIPHAYATPPTWNPFKEGDKSYKDILVGTSPTPNRASPQQVSPVNPPLPHQHQLPLHLQHGSHGVPHLQPPQQTPYLAQPQTHHYPNSQHYEDSRMHLSASTSSVYPSPRMQNAAYPSPMSQAAQLTYGQPIPHYVMGPNGPHPAHFRQFPGGPQMMPPQGPQLAAPMMVQQSSQGGLVPQGMNVPYNPQMPIYPPNQPLAYNGQPQPPSGYPSPGRAAPMMMHQGSHQGQPPQMYTNSGQYGQPVYAAQPPTHSELTNSRNSVKSILMPSSVMPIRGYGSPQPHYNQSPQQHYHYPSQTNRVQSNSYGQPQHQHMNNQHPPPSAMPVEGGEEIK